MNKHIPISDDTIDDAVIENLSRRVAEQQAEIDAMRDYIPTVERYAATLEAKLSTIREETLEEAAKVADKYAKIETKGGDTAMAGMSHAGEQIAKAIRALIAEKPK
jgi:LmbE family N-acetylglucosaminyl deacetylase